MSLKQQGYQLIKLPDPKQEQIDAFNDLPMDMHCGGRQRRRRFSQYRLVHESADWTLERLPHRPFIQSSDYNKFAGGILRHYEPLQFDPTLQVAAAANAIPLDPSTHWQINVHQYRVVVAPDIRGVSVPEGPHRDNHQYVMIAVFDRHKIRGGVTSLMPTGGGEAFYSIAIPAQHALLFDDTRMWHDASDIVACDREGHRDLWVVAFDRWDDRRYGEEFELASMDKPPAVQDGRT